MTDAIKTLLATSHGTDPMLKREVEDAMWADFGRRVHGRIIGPDLIETMARAGLKSKTTIEFATYLRAYILTGTRP